MTCPTVAHPGIQTAVVMFHFLSERQRRRAGGEEDALVARDGSGDAVGVGGGRKRVDCLQHRAAGAAEQCSELEDKGGVKRKFQQKVEVVLR